jgi:FKBP-type peptidyl-prolyl cis-trans isomerase SlpA
MSKVKEGSIVTVHYTGKFEDGEIFDSSLTEGREPLKVKLGEGSLIKGFEDGLYGMETGETKTIELNPEVGYGNYNETLISEVPLTQLPEGVKIGESLQGMTPNGPVNVKIIDITEEMAIVDANHPLSGKNLVFEVEIMGVE